MPARRRPCGQTRRSAEVTNVTCFIVGCCWGLTTATTFWLRSWGLARGRSVGVNAGPHRPPVEMEQTEKLRERCFGITIVRRAVGGVNFAVCNRASFVTQACPTGAPTHSEATAAAYISSPNQAAASSGIFDPERINSAIVCPRIVMISKRRLLKDAHRVYCERQRGLQFRREYCSAST